MLTGSLIGWLAIRFIPPTFPTSPATKSQWWIQIVRQDAQLTEDYFMADDTEKNRQQGGQSGQQSGQSGQYGQKGGQTGQSQQGQSGQQNQEKKGGGQGQNQGQNEEDDKPGQRRAS